MKDLTYEEFAAEQNRPDIFFQSGLYVAVQVHG